jgi:probable rRNA maturation factor
LPKLASSVLNPGDPGNYGNLLIQLDSSSDSISAPSLNLFARRVARLLDLSADISILITGNRQIQQLNCRFRKKDKATDVLSFPRQTDTGRPGGDIAISAQMARQSAQNRGHSLAEELKVLILHGMLHLAGYDHERDNGEMAAREIALRAKLGLPVTLIERTMKPQRPRRMQKKTKNARANESEF